MYNIPKRFVWSKMQAAAGESIDMIIHRKELERRAGSGRFWWGVGESKSNAIEQLLKNDSGAEVLFSHMRSAPAKHDIDPGKVVIWQMYRTKEGGEYHVPGHVVVSSGAFDRRGHPKKRYYALVCVSKRVLLRSGGGTLNAYELQNIGGRMVGSSQTTAVVERKLGYKGEKQYGIDARAMLVRPYFVELSRPRILAPSELRRLLAIGKEGRSVEDWMGFVRDLKSSRLTSFK